MLCFVISNLKKAFCGKWVLFKYVAEKVCKTRFIAWQVVRICQMSWSHIIFKDLCIINDRIFRLLGKKITGKRKTVFFKLHIDVNERVAYNTCFNHNHNNKQIFQTHCFVESGVFLCIIGCSLKIKTHLSVLTWEFAHYC